MRFFYDRTIAVLVLMFVAGVVVMTWHLSNLTNRLMQDMALQGVTAISDALTDFRTLYTSEVVDRVMSRGIEVADDYRQKKGAIPLPVTLTIELANAIGARRTGIRARLYSDFPFPSRKNGGPRDSFEREALRALRSAPEQPFVRFEDYQGRPSLRYATADIMRPSCVHCHNTRPDSPKKDWKVGDVRGALEVIRPLDRVTTQARGGLRNTVLLMGTMGVAGLFALGLVIGRLKRSSEELEDRVRDRTARLEEANRELEAFSYSVSHDLRAPLRAIDGFSQALLEDYQDKLEARGQDYLRRVRAAAQRMATLIDDLLRLSRVTRAEIRHESVDLSSVARTVAAELRQAEPGRQVEIVVQEGLTAQGDPHLLRLVVENLLGNAWKFTGKVERGTIELGALPEARPTTYFVRDNGAGFDMAYAERLFAPFQRLHAAADFPGMGIGLALVQRIVHRHGGRVWAEGAVGRGATFYFTLPEGKTEEKHA